MKEVLAYLLHKGLLIPRKQLFMKYNGNCSPKNDLSRFLMSPSLHSYIVGLDLTPQKCTPSFNGIANRKWALDKTKQNKADIPQSFPGMSKRKRSTKPK